MKTPKTTDNTISSMQHGISLAEQCTEDTNESRQKHKVSNPYKTGTATSG